MIDVFRARWILPVEGRPLENGAVAVRHGRIVEVGRADDIHEFEDPREDRTHVHDLGDAMLLPGFINAHTHLELGCYRGRVPAGPLWEWLDHLTALGKNPDNRIAERQAVVDGAVESLSAGVTCVGDISRTSVHVDALRASPIRKICYLELISGARLPPNDAASLIEMFERAVQSAEPDRLIIGISPHALYTVVPEELAIAARLAANNRSPITIHVLETQDEVTWLADGTGLLCPLLEKHDMPTAACGPGDSAIERLDRAGIMSVPPLLAHVNYIDDDDIERLRTSDATVAWCPRSHDFFGHEPHRWRDMIAAGINVCIGTDSLASNETLSVLDELRVVRQQAPDYSADALLEMGTIRAARGLGLEKQIGSLRPGKYADFVCIPWDAAGPKSPAENLLEGGQTAGGVWIGGERVCTPPR